MFSSTNYTILPKNFSVRFRFLMYYFGTHQQKKKKPIHPLSVSVSEFSSPSFVSLITPPFMKIHHGTLYYQKSSVLKISLSLSK